MSIACRKDVEVPVDLLVCSLCSTADYSIVHVGEMCGAVVLPLIAALADELAKRGDVEMSRVAQ